MKRHDTRGQIPTTGLGIMPQPGSQSSSTDRECRRMDDQQSHMPQSEHAVVWDAMEASTREYWRNHMRHLLAHLPCSMGLCLYGTFHREEQGEDLPKINDACSQKPKTFSQSSQSAQGHEGSMKKAKKTTIFGSLLFSAF